MNNYLHGVKQYEVTWEDQHGLFNTEIVWGADEVDVTRHVLGEYDGATVHCVRVIAMREAPEPCYESKAETSKPDMVNHPSHYTQGGIECIQALEAATINLKGIEAVCTANAIKYLWRWKQKNGVEDLEKARFYINYLINNAELKTGENEKSKY